MFSSEHHCEHIQHDNITDVWANSFLLDKLKFIFRSNNFQQPTHIQVPSREQVAKPQQITHRFIKVKQLTKPINYKNQIQLNISFILLPRCFGFLQKLSVNVSYSDKEKHNLQETEWNPHLDAHVLVCLSTYSLGIIHLEKEKWNTFYIYTSIDKPRKDKKHRKKKLLIIMEWGGTLPTYSERLISTMQALHINLSTQ